MRFIGMGEDIACPIAHCRQDSCPGCRQSAMDLVGQVQRQRSSPDAAEPHARLGCATTRHHGGTDGLRRRAAFS